MVKLLISFGLISFLVTIINTYTGGEYPITLTLPVVSFFALLSLHMKSLERNGIQYSSGWKKALRFAFLMGAIVPFFTLVLIDMLPIGEKADFLGVTSARYLLKILKNIASYSFFSTLLGFFYINAFYPNKAKSLYNQKNAPDQKAVR
jgi:hypothetical protein